MERRIPEADWKRWRKLSQELLERFCTETLHGLTALAKRYQSAHERYLEVWAYLRERDEVMSAIFDNPRRSSAFFQIARAFIEELLTGEELATFTQETQDVVHLLNNLGEGGA
jgi:hypothetical protein